MLENILHKKILFATLSKEFSCYLYLLKLKKIMYGDGAMLLGKKISHFKIDVIIFYHTPYI